MGVKRGKYRRYNEEDSYLKFKKKERKRQQSKDAYEKFYRSTGTDPGAVREETYETKLTDGRRMYIMVVHLEKLNHFLGERISLTMNHYPEKEKEVSGKVIGIYPYFLLLRCGEGDEAYNTTISYTDLIMGRTQR